MPIVNTLYGFQDSELNHMVFQGHDVVILDDLKSMSWRPPVIWIEWFTDYLLDCETPNPELDKCIYEVS